MQWLNQIIIMLSKVIGHDDGCSTFSKRNSNSSGCQNNIHILKMVTKVQFNYSTDTYGVKCRTDSGLTQVYSKDSMWPRALNIHLSAGSGSRQRPQLQALHHLENRQEHCIACSLNKRYSYNTYWFGYTQALFLCYDFSSCMPKTTRVLK